MFVGLDIHYLVSKILNFAHAIITMRGNDGPCQARIL